MHHLDSSELNTLATEVCQLIKEKIGSEEFTRSIANCQKLANEKRQRRKETAALEVHSGIEHQTILDPKR